MLGGVEEFRLRCELNVEMPELGRYLEIARQWLNEGSARLAGERRREIDEQVPPPAEAPMKAGSAGPPGAAWGYVGLGRAGAKGLRVSSRAYSARNLEWLMKQIARGNSPPELANLGLGRLDGGGYPGPYALRMSLERQDASVIKGPAASGPPWLQLVFEAPEKDLLDSQREAGWLGFAYDVAAQLNPSFGLIDYSYGYGPRTAVEHNIGPPWRDPWLAVPQSRQVLRGYGWLTVLAQELAGRLGGAEALQAGGAFHQAQQLPGGGLWLLATAHYRDFDETALRKVFRALAPVLPPGRPSQSARHGPPFRIVYEDAAPGG